MGCISFRNARSQSVNDRSLLLLDALAEALKEEEYNFLLNLATKPALPMDYPRRDSHVGGRATPFGPLDV